MFQARCGRLLLLWVLGVIPAEAGKHDTTATRWNEDKATQKSRDGVVEPDTVSITHTDT